MSISMIIGGEQSVEFATNSGHGDFTRWVDSLDVKVYPTLSHLADWGWVNTLDVLLFELEEAVLDKPPMKTIQQTIDGLIAALQGRDAKAETILLTNGMTSDDDEDGEWWIGGKPV